MTQLIFDKKPDDHEDENKLFYISRAYTRKIISPFMRAVCMHAYQRHLQKVVSFLPLLCSVFILLVYCIYYYYYLRTSCMYICNVVCVCIQLCRKGDRGS